MTIGRPTKDSSDRKKTLAANGWPYGNDRVLDIESGSTRSHSCGQLATEKAMDKSQDRLRNE